VSPGKSRRTRIAHNLINQMEDEFDETVYIIGVIEAAMGVA
jgi:hypothetical protein